jgi:hypothetical protein
MICLEIKGGSEVWVAYCDPGGQNAVEPVATEMERRGYKIERFLGGWARKEAVKRGSVPLFLRDAVAQVDDGKRPALMISSMCTAGGEIIVERLMPRGVSCLAVQDYPGGSMNPEQAWATVRPTKLTVIRPAWNLAIRLWQDFPSQNIISTGSPADDALTSFDIGSARRQARET